MQPTNGFVGGNAQQLTPQQVQQMMLLQQGGQFGNMMGYNAQYAMPAANVGQAQRPASATPPPATSHVQQNQQQQHGLQQQQQVPPVARMSDAGDDGFDLDDIPSPGGTPPGAGAGPAAAQGQHLHQQNLQYSQPVVSQPAAFPHQQTGLQQQQQQLLLQQQQQQQQRQQQQHLSGQQVRSQQSMPQSQGRTHHQPQPHAVQQQQIHSALAAQMGHFPKQQHHGITAATRPGAINPAQQQLPAADQSALHARKAGSIPGALKASPGLQQPAPGQELPAAAQAALAARHAQVQQQLAVPQAQQQPQQQLQHQTAPAAAAVAAAGAGGVKRKREAPPLLPAPEEALTLDTVLYRLRQNLPLTAAAAAGGGGPTVDGPAVSVDDILKKYESSKAKAAAAGAKTGKAGSRDKRADDEHKLLPDNQLKRLLELQGLNKSFRLQPELAEELVKLTDNFVSEALEFGCALAARRSSKVLRTSDLAMYMQRTYHLHIPGFSKEYTPYRRPVASDLHKSRSVAVRKAQLQPQQQAGAQGPVSKPAGAGVRFTVD